MAIPEEDNNTYNFEQECDVQCSEDCLSLRDKVSLRTLDLCNTIRCGCYYSNISDEGYCTDNCKRSCLLIPDFEESSIRTCLA